MQRFFLLIHYLAIRNIILKYVMKRGKLKPCNFYVTCLDLPFFVAENYLLMKTLFCFVFVIVCVVCNAQQNLVPNPSFEEYTTCPNNGGQLEYALYWTNPLIGTTPDYLNSCGAATYSVPSNALGYEPAHSGVAYTAIVTARYSPFSPEGNNYREYLQVELLDTLKSGIDYCFRFYVSACDSAHYVTNNIGIYFSSIEVHDTCYCNLNYIPQFENDSTNNISKIGWTEISGTYKAVGGEKYIIIGNFRDTSNTVAINVGGGGRLTLLMLFMRMEEHILMMFI
jgi:hypothetical protein